MADHPPDDATVEQLDFSIDLGNGTKMTLVMARGDGPLGTRRCGSCSLCCRLLPVASIMKKSGEKCRYSRHNDKGCCSVYSGPLFPKACGTWSCRWLVDPEMGMSRPDRAHYVVDVLPDFIQATQNDVATKLPVVQIWIDPAYPDAHRDPKLRAWIDRNAHETGMGALVRWGSTERALLLLPPLMTDNNEWLEKPAVVKPGSGIGLWNDLE
jgi:hypothetical protein